MALVEAEHASRLIFLDELTSLYNRRFMREYIRDRFDGFVESQTPLSVLMIDLDGFKQINDTHGHLEGDHILQHLSGIIRASIPPESYPIRYAGDEFLVFLEGASGEMAEEVAEEVLARVSEHPFPSSKVPEGIPVRLSIGVATCPEDSTTANDLIDLADKALYHSKSQGKNRATRSGSWDLPLEEQVLKRIPCPRLVGRGAELDALEAFLDPDSGEASHRFFLIEGERGVGKSRLLAEVSQRARRLSLRSSYVRCLESYRSIPYKSIVTFLTEALNREPDLLELARQNLADAELVELGEMITELREPGDPGPRTQSPEERRSSLFHGLANLIDLISESAPIVLQLDDIHYIDEASLELLFRLQDRVGSSLVVIAAGRAEFLSGSAEETPSTRRILDSLRDHPAFSSLSIGNLELADIEVMLQGILGKHEPSTTFAERLFVASGGLPLHVQETLKGLIAKGVLKTQAGDWDLNAVAASAIPASLEDAVHGGMDNFDGDTCDMISQAAVVGPHVSIATLAGVLGKNTGETRRLVDLGRKHRVFENSTADSEEVRFLSQCFQQIIYSDLDGGDRRRVHQKVGEVTELIAGDIIDSDLLGPLAHHFQLSNDQSKADIYGRRVQEKSERLFSSAEVAAEMDLGVAVPRELRLEVDQLPLARQFAKCLSTAVTNMRLYPDGNELVSQAIDAVMKPMAQLMEDLEEVGYAEQGGRLSCNGRQLDHRTEHHSIERMLHLYRDSGIRCCTFKRGVQEADLAKLLRLLSDSREGNQRSVRWWAQELSDRGIEHVTIFPVMYLKLEEEARTWTREQAAVQLAEPDMVVAFDFMRAFASTVSNMRLYPIWSEAVTSTVDRLEELAGLAFEVLPSLTVSVAERTIIVNAVRPNARQHQKMIASVKDLLKVSGVKSLTIKRGVTREEFRSFLARLASPAGKEDRGPVYWRQVLQELQITTIEVESQTFAAAQRGTSDRADDAENELDEMRLCVGRWLEAPLADFLDDQARTELETAVEVLCAYEEFALAQRVIERRTSAMFESVENHRAKAAAILASGSKALQNGPLEWTTDVVLRSVTEVISREDHPWALRQEIELAAQIFRRLIREDELLLGAQLAEAVAELPSGGLGDADSTEAIGKVADEHRDTLLELIRDGKDTEVSRVAANLLRSRGNTTARLLASQLGRARTFTGIQRILGVIELAAPGLGSDFFFLLGHSDVQIRAEMVRAIKRLPNSTAEAFLVKALMQVEHDVIIGALECAHSVKGDALTEAVIALLDRSLGDHILMTACRRLGAMYQVRAIPPLLGILERRPRFFGLVPGQSPSVRAAAATSLGEIGDVEVVNELKRAGKERNSEVSSAARLALEKIRERDS